MSIHLGRVPTCPCFILYTVSEWDQTDDIHISLCRYNEKKLMLVAPSAKTHWYNSLSADSTLYDASSYSNFKAVWYQLMSTERDCVILAKPNTAGFS